MSDTTRLKLPLIAAQQAQKHVTHNEALLKLDVLVQARVLDRDLNTPPANPAEGDAYIVAASATGDWAGQEGNIAAWQNGGWVFHAPSEGWKVWVADEDALYVHDGTAWVRFETGITSVNPVPDGKLGINTTADNTNRLAVKSDAVLFSHDDVTPGSGDVQFKVNKAAAANTASLLFQTGWSGRAELGTSGSDDFMLKMSADGTSWSTSLSASATSGSVDFPSGLTRAGNVVWDDANVGARISSLPENTAPASTLQVVLSDGTRAQLGNLPTSGGTGGGINSLNPADGGQVGINTTADNTNRLAVKSDAVLFSHDDVTPGSGDVQFKVNKAAAANTASLLFQSGWSGRAELGLTGDDDFRVKVSPDGNAWRDAMRVDASGGSVSFPNGHDLQRHLPASVDIAGGTDWWGPADHLTTCYSYGSGLTLSRDRMYFMPFYVPRPLLLLGCFVSLYTASTTAGAVLRTGIYELGTPTGNNWNIGNLVADFGTLPADVADNKIFGLATPVQVQPGWYVTAMGVNGSGAAAIYGRWLTPGTQRVFPYSSGTSSRPRLAGHSLYLYEGNSASEITGGLPATWTRNPVSDATSTNSWIYQMVFPKWRLP